MPTSRQARLQTQDPPRQASLPRALACEATFRRLKDFRRIAICYDKLARNYASTVALAAVIAFWC